MGKFCSIILTHYAMDHSRSRKLRLCLESIFSTTDYPYELIVVDNGGSKEDSEYLVKLADEGKIHTYIRNSRNMSFGWARNQALELAQGDYFCISDNDIEYKPGWLTKCIKVLEAYPKHKYYATPLDYPTPMMNLRYRTGDFTYNGEKYTLSMRAGSNSFVIRRTDMQVIGKFPIHRIAGTKWTDRAVKLKYLAVVLPEGYAYDLGIHEGYNIKEFPGIFIKLSTGEEVYFNQDEFRACNDRIHYSQQVSFTPRISKRHSKMFQRR